MKKKDNDEQESLKRFIILILDDFHDIPFVMDFYKKENMITKWKIPNHWNNAPLLLLTDYDNFDYIMDIRYDKYMGSTFSGILPVVHEDQYSKRSLFYPCIQKKMLNDNSWDILENAPDAVVTYHSGDKFPHWRCKVYTQNRWETFWTKLWWSLTFYKKHIKKVKPDQWLVIVDAELHPNWTGVF